MTVCLVICDFWTSARSESNDLHYNLRASNETESDENDQVAGNTTSEEDCSVPEKNFFQKAIFQNTIMYERLLLIA